MSKIKVSDLSGKIKKPEIKPLSDVETTQIVGGGRTGNGRPSGECPYEPPSLFRL